MPEATTAIEVREPDIKVSKRIKPITDGRLNKAARELDMLSVSSRYLRNVSDVGRFINELGLLNYGHGRLMGSAQMIAEGAASCAALARREGMDDETRRAYLDLQLRFIKALDENVALQLKVNAHAEAVSAHPAMSAAKPFLPGAQISPINLQINCASATETKSEETCKTS